MGTIVEKRESISVLGDMISWVQLLWRSKKELVIRFLE